jgi:choline dehydrogenase
MGDRFDYIIIGAGSAGCVLAARLSEDAATRVLVLEAGPAPRTPWIRIPAGTSQLIFPGKYNWGYSTEPEAHLDGRRVYVPRGRTLGGSSAINGMAYVRGHPQDYDQWRQLGNAGWGWSDVLPYFRKSERYEGGADDLHGGDGEMHVSSPYLKHPASRDFVKAGVALGLTERADLNGPDQEGAGFLHFTIRDGRRHSTYDAFLRPVRHRANLSIVTDAAVQRIEVANRRATGVHFRRGRDPQFAAARREIILCAGALDSPKLLMVSGIGPGETLQKFSIPVVADLAGVGQNLQDHLYVHHTYRATADSSINADLRGLRKYIHGAKYVLSRRGLLSLGASQAAAFVRAFPGSERPDLQLMFRPVSWEFSAKGTLVIGDSPAVGGSICVLRPHARGKVSLHGPSADQPPAIFANYLGAAADRDAVIAGVHWMRRLFQTEPLRSRIVAEVAPGDAVATGDEIIAYARKTLQSMHHWSGTCKMGDTRNDPLAVVDQSLQVRGVDGLRVVDAAIMPLIPSGNTNAPTIMVAEKAADLIRQQAKQAA